MDEPDDNDYDWHDETINLQRVCPGEAPHELQIAIYLEPTPCPNQPRTRPVTTTTM